MQQHDLQEKAIIPAGILCGNSLSSLVPDVSEKIALLHVVAHNINRRCMTVSVNSSSIYKNLTWAWPFLFANGTPSVIWVSVFWKLSVSLLVEVPWWHIAGLRFSSKMFALCAWLKIQIYFFMGAMGNEKSSHSPYSRVRDIFAWAKLLPKRPRCWV